jgi:hypothetical protein
MSLRRKQTRIRWWRYRNGQKVLCPHRHKDGVIYPCEPHIVRCRQDRNLDQRLYRRRKAHSATTIRVDPGR